MTSWIATALKCGTALACLASVVANAQSASGAASAEPTSPPPVAAADAGSGEIIVTARRREEAISKVPEAITAITSEMIEHQSVKSLDDIRNITPGLVVINSPIFRGTLASFIRGIGETGTDQSADPVIANYVNGIYMPHGTVALFNLFDVQRVEVLRGSQGTLFGKNTTAGAVVITTKDPGKSAAGELNVLGGSHGLQQYTGAVDVPLGSDFAVRVAGGYRKSDGDYLNGFNGKRAGGENVALGRVTAVYRPDSPLHVRVVLEALRDTSDTPGVSTTAAPGLASTVRLASLPAPVVPYGERRPGLVYNANGYDGNETQQQTAVLDMSYDFPGFGTLTSITGYFNLKSHQFVQNSGIPSHFLDYDRRVERRQVTQEIRLAQTIGKLDIVSGLFYAHAALKDGNLVSGEVFGGPPFTTVGSQPAYKFKQRDESAAVFADGILRLTSNLRINAGLRYSWQRKNAKDGVPCGVSVTPGDFTPCARLFFGEDTWKSLDPKIGLDLDLNANTLAYLKFSTGFRSGGFNGRSAIGQLGPYKPERVKDHEIGLKGKLLDNRLSYSLVGFVADYKDLQLQFVRRVPNPFTGPATVNDTVVRNAASEKTKGIELEAEFRIVPGLTIAGSAAYLDAKFGKGFIVDLGAGQLVNLSGNTPRFSPEFTTSVRARYETEIGNIGSGSVSLTYATSSSYNTYNNIAPGDLAFAHDNGYGRLDGVLGWVSPDRHFEVQLVGRNLTNAYYLTFANQAPGAAQFFGTAPGRTVYAELKVHF